MRWRTALGDSRGRDCNGAGAALERLREALANRTVDLAASEPSPKFELKAERVWLVERSGATELYSNGLRIDRSMQISNRPRATYPMFNADSKIIRTSSTPAGIVYHTTESLIAPSKKIRIVGCASWAATCWA